MHETPQFELPKPAVQRAPELRQMPGQESAPGRAFPERLAPRDDQSPVSQTAPQMIPAPLPVARPLATAQTQLHDQSSQIKGPATADDVDVIEKEWVTRAKQILNHTRHDPYRKSTAINALKNDYLTKRFGRTKG